MVVGGGRVVGAWMMAVAAVFVFVGVVYVTESVADAQRQAADLDESEGRAMQWAVSGLVGASVLAFGALLALVAGVTYLVSSVRSRRRTLPRDAMPRGIALGSLGAILLFAGYAVLAPGGPTMTALGVAAGGGGPSNALQLEQFSGGFTAAAFQGASTMADVHAFDPVADRGEFRMRLLSGGQGVNAVAVAILEEADGGGWRELLRTSGAQDSTVDLPARAYDADLRIRVQPQDGSAGEIEYELFVSFQPLDP